MSTNCEGLKPDVKCGTLIHFLVILGIAPSGNKNYSASNRVIL